MRRILIWLSSVGLLLALVIAGCGCDETARPNEDQYKVLWTNWQETLAGLSGDSSILNAKGEITGQAIGSAEKFKEALRAIIEDASTVTAPQRYARAHSAFLVYLESSEALESSALEMVKSGTEIGEVRREMSEEGSAWLQKLETYKTERNAAGLGAQN